LNLLQILFSLLLSFGAAIWSKQQAELHKNVMDTKCP